MHMIWIGAWTAIYLPWHSALEYYMLPCAIGCAIVGGVGAGQVSEALQGYGHRVVRTVGACAAALVAVTCVNNWTNGRYQITMDRSNMALIEYLGSLPAQSRVLVNIAEPNEYEYEIGVHLVELKGRSDISVDYFRFQTGSSEEGEIAYYVATPVVKNEIHPSVRYALHQPGAMAWGRALTDFLGSKPEVVYKGENQMRIVDIGLHRLLCPFWGPSLGLYCGVPRPFIDGRLLTFGWEVYRVSRRIEEVARPARMARGCFSRDRGPFANFDSVSRGISL